MAKTTLEISDDLMRQIDRIIREGWYASPEAVVQEALHQFLEARSFLGDSPRMLQRFAADALNESKPDTALKFIDRALSLLTTNRLGDLDLYQSLIELRVQILLIQDRAEDALHTLEEARERLPNSPGIQRWIDRVRSRLSSPV